MAFFEVERMGPVTCDDWIYGRLNLSQNIKIIYIRFPSQFYNPVFSDTYTRGNAGNPMLHYIYTNLPEISPF